MFRENSVRLGFVGDSEFRKPRPVTEESLDLEMLAQHYGIPTRLLDWSESFHTALFFAFGGWTTVPLDGPCVWRIDRDKFRRGTLNLQRKIDSRHKLSEKQLEENYKKHPTAIQFIHRDASLNVRVRKQRGWFTYQVDALTPLCEYVENHAAHFPGGTLTKISLRAEDQSEALVYLADAGTIAGAIRHDLEGVSADVRNRTFRFKFEEI